MALAKITVSENCVSSYLRKFNLNMWIEVPEAIFVSALYKNGFTKNRTRG